MENHDTTDQVQAEGDMAGPQTEEARPIPGYPGYLATRAGRIYSTLGRGPRSSQKIRPACERKQQLGTTGYLFVNLHSESGVERVAVHRLLAFAFLPPPTVVNGQLQTDVRHKDGMKLNNNVDNLEWGTPAENLADRIRHGTMTWGSRNGACRLSESEVIEMRRLRTSGMTYEEIGKRFRVAYQTAHRACVGDSWSHLESEPCAHVRKFRRENRAAAKVVDVKAPAAKA
jgi:hypothetical protein